MAEIKQAKFIDQTGQEKDAVFIGAEKAIFDDNGERLDHKMEERKKATGLVATDTSGIAGEAGLEVSLQVLIDSVAEKVVNELVTNSALTQTLANYMTKAMMSNVQINDQNKVPTSALAFAMDQAITQNKNAITQLNSDLRKRLGAAMNIVGSITAFADTCPMGLTVVITGNDTTQMPGMTSKYTIGLVLNRSLASGTIILFSYSNKEIYMINKSDSWDSTATVIK